jgi:radical SAM superfamily enzyme YgiQ (UPF0313 family)
MQKDFKEALKDTTDICKFEFWIRFYFVQEKEGGELEVHIPEETMDHIRREYSELAGLAEKMNDTVITPEKNRKTIIDHISSTLDGPKYSPSLVPQVLNSKTFEAEMSAFHIWANAQQEELDSRIMDFREWMQLFEGWKRTEEGRNMLARLKSAGEQQTDRTQ